VEICHDQEENQQPVTTGTSLPEPSVRIDLTDRLAATERTIRHLEKQYPFLTEVEK